MNYKSVLLFLFICFTAGCTSPEKTIPTRPASNPDNVDPKQSPPEYQEPSPGRSDTLQP